MKRRGAAGGVSRSFSDGEMHRRKRHGLSQIGVLFRVSKKFRWFEGDTVNVCKVFTQDHPKIARALVASASRRGTALYGERTEQDQS